MTDEALISVNGKVLTKPQSITVRVALENFRAWLETNGLGSDEHGRNMKALYIEHINEVRSLIFTDA